MSEIKIKHHFIPVSLLAGFTKRGTKESVLWVFDQETGRQWESKPSSVGFENNLYTIDIADLERDDIENVFMQIENRVAPIIVKILDTREIPSGEEFNDLMYYIALQYARTPKRKEGFSKPVEDMAKIIAQMSVSSQEHYEKILKDLKKVGKDVKGIDYESMRHFVMNQDAYEITLDNNTKMNNVFTVIEAILPTLIKRKWSVIYCPPVIGDFICSDNPVNLHWSTQQSRGGLFTSPGHGLKNTEVSLPISSRVMLLGRYDNFQPPSGIVPNKKTLAILNSFTGIESNRFIYSRKQDFYWLSTDGHVANIEDFKTMIHQKNKGML